MFQPLVIWCIFFSLGICAGRYISLPGVVFLFLGVICLVAATVYVYRRKLSSVLIFGFAFCFGALNYINCGVGISEYEKYQDKTVFLHGFIASAPHISNKRIIFDISPKEVIYDGIISNTSSKLRVISFKNERYLYGDEVLIEGRFHDFKGIKFVSKKDSISIVISKGKGPILERIVIACREKAADLFSKYLNPEYRDILAAMILGEAGKIPRVLKADMVRTGTWHLMVVSGSHTALLAYIILMFLKIVRLQRSIRLFVTIIFVVMYCLVTGASAPVVRATVMTIAFIFSYILKRNPHFLNSLALAAIVILIFDPRQIFNLGFQLSFLSVFFIFWLYLEVHRVLLGKVANNRLLYSLACGLCVSLCAWIGTTPLLAYKYGNISIVAIFANMVLAPLAAFVLAAGLVFIAATSLFPVFAVFAASACECLVFIFIKINWFFARLPFASCVLCHDVGVYVLIFSVGFFILSFYLKTIRQEFKL